MSEPSFQTVAAHLETPADFVRWGASRFAAAGLHFGHGTANAIDDAAALVLHALHLPHDAPPRLLDARLLPEEKRRVHALIERRIAERIPTPYLTGEAWFAGLRFVVDERVLVPRSPIAELIERGFEPWLEPERVLRVLDLCTGSGCIAIACALAFPAAQVDGTDVSTDALAVAGANRALHGLGDRVAFHAGDLWADREPGYDLIVANPPYVDAAEMAALPPEHRHEPALALAAGGDGLDVAMRILREAPRYLAADGLLVCEVGASATALEQRCPRVPFTWIEFERGGDGVFVMTADELVAHAASFA
jgi:ribosomal protein L3 glutamine methyltransferase